MSSAREHRELRDKVRVELGREPDLLLWPNEGGIAKYGGSWVKYGLIDGATDLIGIGPHGQFVGWEIKTGGARLEPAQRRFRDLVLARGGAHAVIHSVEEAWSELHRLRASHSHLTTPEHFEQPANGLGQVD